jgi:hypothetical protein
MINLVLNLTNQVGVSGYKLCIKIFLKCRDWNHFALVAKTLFPW